jgi:hypothetical protein
MREYKIIRIERWWILSRKKQIGKLMLLQFLYWNLTRWSNKWIAKVFYTESSAVSGLTAMRIKDGKKKSD